ncbi:reverse transcriptase [Lasius niger]|uniref:Reverse transcriptase n=1 Tax=Lasius niger TaxID=67767 RepID=A0A0J7NEG9_LASNI|nr:reverse transcriptase [Lasius niger]
MTAHNRDDDKWKTVEPWKRANLVLIPKGVAANDSLLKARPICLLDELGKAFERVIAARMQDWMDNNPESGFSVFQFGFRRHRYTVDALFSVKNFIEVAVYRGEVAIAVGLDIPNAFNSIPWRIINDTLDARGFPDYLRRVIRSYLSNRVIDYRVRDGLCESRLMSAGVSQGSVLEPLLWNVAFDSVLRVEQEVGCRTVCYADDTLIVATAAGAFDAVLRANVMAACIVRRIKSLVYVESKAAKVSRALFRLMPNLRGPYEDKRRLYASVLTSVVTYAAPVWCDALSSASSKKLQPIVRLQRSIAIRVVSGYRTISFDVAALLACMPSWTLEVSMRRRVYERVTDLRRRGKWSKKAVAELKEQERNMLNRQWSVSLNRSGAPGILTRELIMPYFSEWLSRRFGNVSFRFTQMITGHGCFGHYLHRMRKRDSPACLHCSCLDDTVLHTIYECPAWMDQRTELWLSLSEEGNEMDLGTVVRTILESQVKWHAFSLFANSVYQWQRVFNPILELRRWIPHRQKKGRGEMMQLNRRLKELEWRMEKREREDRKRNILFRGLKTKAKEARREVEELCRKLETRVHIEELEK